MAIALVFVVPVALLGFLLWMDRLEGRLLGRRQQKPGKSEETRA